MFCFFQIPNWSLPPLTSSPTTHRLQKFCVHECAKLLQLCPTLCDPMDHGLPGSSVRGILQQEYWSGLPCPPPGIFPTQGSNPCLLRLLHWPTGSLPLAPPGKPQLAISPYKIKSKKKKFTFFFFNCFIEISFTYHVLR